MSPRKTRRGAKADGANETLSETISKISKENSPLLSQRTMRTRRQLSKTISQESDADQSLEMNKSKRKVVQEVPSVRSKRSRKKALDENVIDESSSALDVIADTRKRTRRAKDNSDVSSNQTILLDGSTVDEPRIEKSRGTRARKRVAKKENTKSEGESEEIAIGERSSQQVVVENVTIIEDSHMDPTINETEAPISKEDAEVERASTRNSRFRASASTPSSPRSVVKRRARNTRARFEVCTPESSPITVNLSPHRTTKTPRKSPMNLGGSPKSHADQSSFGLTKTPRKLPVVEESPSERSINSSINGTPERSLDHLSLTDGILDSSSARKKKRTPKIKSPVKTPRKSPKDPFVRKFSKSPKIVLRTPKAKSSRSKSPRVVTSKANISPVPKRFTKSPVKSRESQSDPAGSSETSMIEKIISPTSPKKAKRSQSPKKSVTTTGVATKSTDSHVTLHLSRIDSPSNVNEGRVSRNTSPTKGSRSTGAQKSPTVVLNKISTPGDVEPEATTTTVTRRSLSRRSNTSIGDSSTITPVKTPSAEIRATQGCESPRRSRSAEKKRASIADSGTPLRPTESPRSSAPKSSIGKSVINSARKSTPVDGRLLMARGKIGSGGNAPMLSSTPRERIRRSLNLSPGLAGTPSVANSPVNGSPLGSSTLVGEVRTTRRSRIEDVTNPLISEDDESFSLNEIPQNTEESRLDDTFQIVKKNILNVEEEEEEEEEEEGKAVDGTYELIEPKTPTLRRRAAKRSPGETNTNAEEKTTKRICRVRFASPSLNSENKETLSGGTGRSRSATPGQRVGQKRFTPGISNVSIGRTANNSRRRSNSVTSVPLTKTPIAGMKRRSSSASDATSASKTAISANKTAQNESVNRLSKPRLYIHQPNKKSELKTPLARKAPNFAQIHERKFAKMESLVDAKKRVENRHLAIKSQIPQNSTRVNTATRSKPKVSPKRAAPSVPVNGAYNRYGFKLRKDDAMKMVTHKQPTHTREKKRNENLLLIKGVRTNRRFELIMKARNINQ